MYKFFINIILFLLLSIIIAKLFRNLLKIILTKKENVNILNNRILNFFNLIGFIFIFIFFSYYIFYLCIILILLLLLLIVINTNNYFKINKDFFGNIFFKIYNYYNNSNDIFNEKEDFIFKKYTLGNGYSIETVEKKIILYGYLKSILCIFNKEIKIYGKIKFKSCIFEDNVLFNVFDLKINKTTFKENVTIIFENKDFYIENIELNNVIFEKNLILQGLDNFKINQSCKIYGKTIYKE